MYARREGGLGCVASEAMLLMLTGNQSGQTIKHQKSQKNEIPLENATESPLDNSSNNPLDKWQSFGKYH